MESRLDRLLEHVPNFRGVRDIVAPPHARDRARFLVEKVAELESSLTEQDRELRESLRELGRLRQRRRSGQDLPAGDDAGVAALEKVVRRQERRHRLLPARERVALGLGRDQVDDHVEVAALDNERFPGNNRATLAVDVQKDRAEVLLVAPMSGHYATLLRKTVISLLPDCEVFVTDWHNARDIPVSAGKFDIEDYTLYLVDFLRALGPDTHVIAVCQPAPLALAATAYLAEEDPSAQPRTLTLIGILIPLVACNNDSPEKIIERVKACPSGALAYRIGGGDVVVEGRDRSDLIRERRSG